MREDAVASLTAAVTVVDLVVSFVFSLLVVVLVALPVSLEHLPSSSREVNRTLLQAGNYWLLLPPFRACVDSESRDLFFSWQHQHQSPHKTQSEGLP